MQRYLVIFFFFKWEFEKRQSWVTGQTGDRVLETGPSSRRRQLQEGRSEPLAPGWQKVPSPMWKGDRHQEEAWLTSQCQEPAQRDGVSFWEAASGS